HVENDHQVAEAHDDQGEPAAFLDHGFGHQSLTPQWLAVTEESERIRRSRRSRRSVGSDDLVTSLTLASAVLSRTARRRRRPDDGSRREDGPMKYVALIYSNPGAFEAMSPDERNQMMSEADAYLKEFTESGELLGEGFALADASTGKTVRVRNGLPNVTDGPF